MENPHQSLIMQQCFEKYINLAYSTIGLSSAMVLQSFKNKDVSVMNHLHKGFDEKAIEVRLDKVSLCCLFDTDDACNSTFLCLDDPDYLKLYIDYCSQTYTYNFLLNGWMVKNCCLRVQRGKEEFFFALLPVSTEYLR